MSTYSEVMKIGVLGEDLDHLDKGQIFFTVQNFKIVFCLPSYLSAHPRFG